MKKPTVMIIGSIGHVGPYVVDETIRLGYKVRSIIWDAEKFANLPAEVDRVEGVLTDVSKLGLPLEGVDGLICQVGLRRDVGNNPETINYEELSNLMKALQGRKIPVVLLTAANSFLNTNEIAPEAYFQMRLAELLVRSSGVPYTIVRSGKLLNGLTVNPRITAVSSAFTEEHSEDQVSRASSLTARQLGRVLANAVFNEKAHGKTIEIYATQGEELPPADIFNDVPDDEFDAVKSLERNDNASSSFPPEIIDDIRSIKHMFDKAEQFRAKGGR
ncbi:MAG: NAD(P)H-binding protein [Succinivibrio sp.]|nr:NAD(P)H-binding protein [Succinivibrio sp.]